MCDGTMTSCVAVPFIKQKQSCSLGCHHSSVDLSVPIILLPQVRVPSTPSMLLLSIVKVVLYLSCEKNENKQKEAGFGPFKKQSYSILPKVVSKSCKGKQYLYSTLSRRFRIGPNESFSSRKT